MTQIITLMSCLTVLLAATLPFLRIAARRRYRADVEDVMRSVLSFNASLEAAHRKLDAMAPRAADRGNASRNTA